LHNVLIDITRLIARRWGGTIPTGIDRVGLEYLRHYRGEARAVISWGRMGVVLSKGNTELATRLLLESGTDATLAIVRLIASACTTPLTTQNMAAHFLINTGHFGLEDTQHAVAFRRRNAELVFVVHDLIPLSHPEYCRPGESERHSARMRNVLTLGRGIIANSQDTLDALSNFADVSGLYMPPSVVAPLAAGLLQLTPGRRPIERPYFVMLSTIEPRKNHLLLLQIWRRLIEQLGRDAPQLVVIGQRGWECENVVDMLERCNALRGFVTEHSKCSDEELTAYLQHAQALLFPSFVEGYGLPLAESLLLGVPAIVSDLAVFREFAGNVPEYLDPMDAISWMAMIVDYAKPYSNSRARQLQRLQEHHLPTWAQHMEKVDAFLGKLSSVSHAAPNGILM
jgi:glycosyltransferase involved in cell wall biosynthesis